MNKIMEQWKSLESCKENKSGAILQRNNKILFYDCYIALYMPRKYKSIAFKTTMSKANILNEFVDTKDIKIKYIEKHSGGEENIFMFCLENDDLSDIFAILCEDLFDSITEIENESELLISLSNRYRGWIELLKKINNKILNISAQVGLYGELYFLNKLIDFTIDPIRSVDLWVGPNLSIKDFECDNWAVEVKTTSSHNQKKVSISSARQLDCSKLADLFLYHLLVEIRIGSINTLNHLIEEIISKIANFPSVRSKFEKKLIKVGYLSSEKEAYENRSYFIRAENIYKIADDFPRIEEAELRENVYDVKYSIIPSRRFKTDFKEIISTIEVKK